MSTHSSHSTIANRLRKAEGHLKRVIAMLEEGRRCVEVAQQLQAVESAIHTAKKTLVRDHIDHCLEHAVQQGTQSAAESIEEFKSITKYL